MTMLNWHLIERKNMESKILVDTNVLLDYFLTREPFFNDAKQIIEKCAEGKINACIAAHSVSTHKRGDPFRHPVYLIFRKSSNYLRKKHAQHNSAQCYAVYAEGGERVPADIAHKSLYCNKRDYKSHRAAHKHYTPLLTCERPIAVHGVLAYFKERGAKHCGYCQKERELCGRCPGYSQQHSSNYCRT